MKKSTILFYKIIVVVLMLVSAYFFYYWNLMQDSLYDLEPIEYRIKNKYYAKGRSNTKSMDVAYRDDTYRVSLTTKDYHGLKEGMRPELFYLEDQDFVFYRWTATKFLRVSILGLAGSLVFMVLLWKKWG